MLHKLQSFSFWFIGIVTISSPVWELHFVPFNLSGWFFTWIVSSWMSWSVFNWIPEREPLQISRILSLCSSLFSSTLPWKLKLAGLLGYPASSIQLRETTRLCLDPFSLFHGLCTFSRKYAREIIGFTSLACHLSGGTTHCCLMLDVLRTIISDVVSRFVISGRRENPVPVTPLGQKLLYNNFTLNLLYLLILYVS